MTMSREPSTLTVTFLLLLSIFSIKALPLSSKADNLPWLKTDGRWITDEGGDLVLLRGADYMGMEFGWFGHSEDDFKRMESWGFNVVRLPIAWSYVEPIEGRYNDSYLEKVDRVIAWCKNTHLYVILDMHQWNWAPKYQGNGLPDWAVAQVLGSRKSQRWILHERDHSRSILQHVALCSQQIQE